MTTNLTSVKNTANNFPLIFGEGFFEDFFNNLPSTKLYPTQVAYPYNVENYVNEDGIQETTILTFAMAGVPKSAISIDVSDNILTVSVDKTSPSRKASSGKWILSHKGISQRYGEIKFRLQDADEKRITSTFQDGLLEIVIPAVKHSKQTIKIN